MADIDLAGLGKRIRAIMAHLGMETVRELADAIGAERGAVSNWINAATSGNPPPVSAMMKLIDKERDLTLDWIYTGNPDRLPTGLSIRLTALVDQVKVPESAPEPREPAQDRVSASLRRRRGQPAI